MNPRKEQPPKPTSNKLEITISNCCVQHTEATLIRYLREAAKAKYVYINSNLSGNDLIVAELETESIREAGYITNCFHQRCIHGYSVCPNDKNSDKCCTCSFRCLENNNSNDNDNQSVSDGVKNQNQSENNNTNNSNDELFKKVDEWRTKFNEDNKRYPNISDLQKHEEIKKVVRQIIGNNNNLKNSSSTSTSAAASPQITKTTTTTTIFTFSESEIEVRKSDLSNTLNRWKKNFKDLNNDKSPHTHDILSDDTIGDLYREYIMWKNFISGKYQALENLTEYYSSSENTNLHQHSEIFLRKKELAHQLNEWKTTFRAKHRRTPTKEDIEAHTEISKLFDEYNKINDRIEEENKNVTENFKFKLPKNVEFQDPKALPDEFVKVLQGITTTTTNLKTTSSISVSPKNDDDLDVDDDDEKNETSSSHEKQQQQSSHITLKTSGPTIREVTPCHLAALVGNVEYLQSQLLLLVEQQEEEENENKTTTTTTTNNNGKELMNKTLAQGGRHITEFAMRSGEVPVLQFLHENNILNLSVNKENKFPILIACQQGRVAVFEFLVEKGLLEISSRNKDLFHDGTSFFHHCARNNHATMIKYLHSSGLTQDFFEGEKEPLRSAFCQAVVWNALDSARALFECDLHLRDLKKAMFRPKVSVESLFKKRRIMLKSKEENDNNGGNNNNGGDIKDDEEEIESELREVNRETHRIFISKRGFPPIPIMTETEKKKNDEDDNDNESAASKSTTNNNISNLLSSSLVPQGKTQNVYVMTLDSKRNREQCPLHLACDMSTRHDNIPLIKFLIEESGFRIDINGKSGHSDVTPLIVAVKRNRPDVVKLLLDEYHADIDAYQSSDGSSCCYIAAYYNYPEVLKILLERGCNSSKMYENRSTPFVGAISAVKRDSSTIPESLKILIQFGRLGKADITTPRLGESALDYAMRNGKHLVVRYLKENLG